MNSTPDGPDEHGEAGEPAPNGPDEPEDAGESAAGGTPEPEDAQPAPPPSYQPPAPVPPGPTPGTPAAAAPVAPPPYDPATAASPYGPPPVAYPGAAPGTARAAQPERPGPGIGAGIGAGCGLQFLASLIFLFSMFAAGGLWGPLVPAILITVAGIVLMFFARWRRFATGVLIASAATWLIFLGPCIALVGGFR